MVYKATEDVVRRVMPLLEALATRTIDKARLLQYLSARAGVDWGALELAGEMRVELEDGSQALILRVREPGREAERQIPYSDCLPPDLDLLVREEYKRLATAAPLTAMAEQLFEALFGESHCARCRWRRDEYRQLHLECRFAGKPLNFEPASDASSA